MRAQPGLVKVPEGALTPRRVNDHHVGEVGRSLVLLALAAALAAALVAIALAAADDGRSAERRRPTDDVYRRRIMEAIDPSPRLEPDPGLDAAVDVRAGPPGDGNRRKEHGDGRAGHDGLGKLSAIDDCVLTPVGRHDAHRQRRLEVREIAGHQVR